MQHAFGAFHWQEFMTDSVKHVVCTQGTNAHVLLETPGSALPDAAGGFTWQRRRFWVGPAAHCLLQRFTGSARGAAVVRFELALSQLRLWPLQHHQVRLLPTDRTAQQCVEAS
jgi:hypothetical protein